MMKELLLLRHGKSDWSTNSSDFDRPLKKRGKRNAKLIGKWLLDNNLTPDLILSSPANRAISTAKIVTNVMQLSEASIKTDHRVYGADLDDLVQILSEIPRAIQKVLLVGHNPNLEELVEHFVPDIQIPPDGKLLPTATLAYFRFIQEWGSLANIKNLVSCRIQRP